MSAQMKAILARLINNAFPTLLLLLGTEDKSSN